MKRASLFNKFFAVVFAAIVVFTVSVREVHYLFNQHEAHEHCENHLHNSNHHQDCSACKFDVSIFTDNVFFLDNSPIFCFEKKRIDYKQSLNLHFSFFNLSLRGPPAAV
jgi:hypothetical protein